MQSIYLQLTVYWYSRQLCSIDWGSRSTSGCIGMQGICLDWLVGSICLLYISIVLDLAVGVVVCKASVLNWLGVSICLLYICIVLDLAVAVVVCKASIFNWLCTGIQGIYAQLTSIYMYCTRSSSGCQWYVMVCKASMLQLTGGPSAFYAICDCTRSSSGCSGMQGICAWLTRGSLPSIYMI